MNPLAIEIYSDLICPWCYIGRRRTAIACFGGQRRLVRRLPVRNLLAPSSKPSARFSGPKPKRAARSLVPSEAVDVISENQCADGYLLWGHYSDVLQSQRWMKAVI
jgi:predicted DsbA family dithiol-disulfide isomerase